MSSLFSSLQTASAALDVFSQALGASQTNIADTSTPGYAAIRANIAPIDLSGDGSSASDYVTLSSTGNALADAQVRAATSAASESQTTADQLTPVNQLFDITGSSGILAAFQQFSSAFSNLSASPNDPTLGAQALTVAGHVASAFQGVAGSLTTESQQIASSIQGTVQQINSLAGQIRQINGEISGESTLNTGADAGLRSDLAQLSSLVDITVTPNADGSVSVLAGGEVPLVLGTQSYLLSADPSQAPGSQVTSSAGGSSPLAFSGQLGALLNASRTINQVTGSLNTLASGFATEANTLLASGVASSGAAGIPIFTFNPSSAAATLAVDPAVTADQLGLGTTGASATTNGIANQLAALPAAANVIGTGSAEDYFGSLAASIGQQLSDAQSASTADQATLTSAQSSQQQRSGVSLDQEAVNITTDQRAYQASAQVVSILDQITSDAVNMLDGNAL